MDAETCKKYFDVLEDTRYKNFVKHKLWHILTLVMCAVMCGWADIDDIVTYGKGKAAFLKERFGMNSIPSKSTLSRVLGVINGEAVANCVVNIMRDFIGAPKEGDIVAFDGKAIRQTFQDARCERVHIVSAFVTSTGVLLGQRCIAKKTNEIPVVQDMLNLFNICGKIVTADAMHCQNDTVEAIIDNGGDYFIGLKANQKNFLKDMQSRFDKDKSDGHRFEKGSTSENNRGRIEFRYCRKLNIIDEYKDWKGLKAVYEIDRTVLTWNAKRKKQEHSRETSYYISSLDVSPVRAIEIAREHWGVEAMHNVLDVSFREDDCRVISKNGQITLNVYRKLANAMHRTFIDKITTTETKRSINGHMKDCLLNDSLLIDVIQG